MHLPDIIRADRLVVRPFRETDYDRYLRFMTDERATRYLQLDSEQKTEAGARILFDHVLASYTSADPVWALAIETDVDGYVGSCGIAPVEGLAYECYYTLLPEYRGRGYATEATRALLSYVFSETPIVEIRAYMGPDNPDSAGVARRAGMIHRGIRQHPEFKTDALLFSIGRSEWMSAGPA